jgi:hypothetical protein
MTPVKYFGIEHTNSPGWYWGDEPRAHNGPFKTAAEARADAEDPEFVPGELEILFSDLEA